MNAVGRRLLSLVPELSGRRVVVVGDLVLDEYVFGRPTRVSREAPVLVLEFSRRFYCGGGAGNPALNIQALGAVASLVATVGDDEPGRRLCEELGCSGLCAEGIALQAGGSTAVKTRLLAEDSSTRQHVVRIDHRAPPPDAPTRAALLDCLRAAAVDGDAVLISDYKGGVVDQRMVDLVREIGRERAILTTVDSQGDLALFSDLDLVKCNRAEAEASLGRVLDTDAKVATAGRELLESLRARYVVLTRGPDGLSVFERGRDPSHVPAANRTEVFDVTGAGDTVIAVLTLALIAGASLAEAADLASLAAGLVVRRLGVATVTPAELEGAIRQSACL